METGVTTTDRSVWLVAGPVDATTAVVAQRSAWCYRRLMADHRHEITQRELRNDSGQILREVEAGATFVVTRNGTPVAELHPLRRRAFVPTTELMTLFAGTEALDAKRFFADLDGRIDQGLIGG
jgi:prevent-host-death family protein